ncbi:MAG: SUMF1/EgtB/PvdO family nonheme iron enzyme [Phycisphaerales bacterium]|nr:SUMF1/EgtB/PvdO family nonheme iron enzyme [Phycisphaerales bacterium]
MAGRSMDGLRATTHAAGVVAVAALVGAAEASPPPDYDFDWATIGDVGNAAYFGPNPYGGAWDRGSVSYVYRMSKMEVTTAQWLEFANAMGALGDPFGIGNLVTFWGADQITAPPGQFRYGLRGDMPEPERMPVFGMPWYNAARYCNWLHNNKELSLDALITGAYDTTTWRIDPNTGRRLADERRLPWAKFWIPSWDEWIKAAHWDPTKDGVGGWWLYPHQSDDPLIYGLPAEGGQSNAMNHSDDYGDRRLGLYPDVMSYYGLLDLSGGASEWIEDFVDTTSQASRRIDGTRYLSPSQNPDLDAVFGVTTGLATNTGRAGVRIASRAVPAPAGSALFILSAICVQFSQRRRTS